MAANPVNQSVRGIDQDSWLLGDRFILSKTDSPVSDMSQGAGNGSIYNLTIATEPLPQSRALAETSHIPKVHDAVRRQDGSLERLLSRSRLLAQGQPESTSRWTTFAAKARAS